MRTDASELLREGVDRTVSVELWKDTSVADILGGLAGDPIDLSPNTSKVSLTESNLKVSLAHNDEFLSCSTQPQPGDLLTVKTGSVWRFIGIISSIDSFTETRGERTMDITARTRDGMGGWKSYHATSQVFPLGTNLTNILESVCQDLMDLEESEFSFPSLTYIVPHANAQFLDETPWSMITTVLESAYMVPFVNVLNQITCYSKSIERSTDIEIPYDRVIGRTRARQAVAVGKVRLRWLDPRLTKTWQQEQLLYETSMTAGFFKLHNRENTWYSQDRKQRAGNVYWKKIDSVNTGGILPDVADEDFEVIDEYHGRITLTTYSWVPTLLALATVTLLASAEIPDGVVIPTPLTGVGYTVPEGRLIEAAAISAVFVIMLSIGVGHYEVWGEPYDYVHAKNTTVAYASNYPSWTLSEVELENDLIASDDHASSVAYHELVHQAMQAYTTTVTLVDDPRIEIGDILGFEDGFRIMVSGFSCDLTRGAEAIMKVTGTRA